MPIRRRRAVVYRQGMPVLLLALALSGGPTGPARAESTAPAPAVADSRPALPRAPGFFTADAGMSLREGLGLALLQGPQATPAPPDHADPDAPDLTHLSLEDLLNLEITTINVLGSHTHLKGEWMVAYRYMVMDMGGYLDGTDHLSDAQVLKRYPTIHTGMTMQMHMLELMHASSDRLTWEVMIPYKLVSMDHLMSTGMRFTTHTEGLSDIEIMALHTLLGNPRRHGDRLLLNTGLSIPTGTVHARDSTPSNPAARLEYMAQLGSGTVDLLPGITYLADRENWAWGAQALGTVRLGNNDIGYRFGNQYRLTAWGVYKVNDWLAPSLRLDGHFWGNVHGMDPELDPAGNPESDPNKQGGRRLDLLFGLNLYAPKGKFKGMRLSVEGGFPIYQSLDGPQIKTDWQFNAGLSYTFR